MFKSAGSVYAYPGIRPEMILVIDGVLHYSYLGKTHSTNKSLLASHIDQEFLFNTSYIQAFVIIQFKPRAIASLQPFVKIAAKDLMKNSICDSDLVFGDEINVLTTHLKNKGSEEIVDLLDEWFYTRLDDNRIGFITDVFEDADQHKTIQSMLKRTNYSYSTLERYFKKETGMTPKKYQTLRRYKQAVEEIYDSQNNDWIYYVEKYGYYDQSHFIKEIKRYTNFTPQQLLQTPGLRTYRPL